ncbi:MAG: LPS export ABC transporter periplasmic protein LptC, partial [Prevotellaceae bacterium]|nr:LPS export ABC transporter periplasmic protein LptC [Prevotellaceae bacterium]
MNIHLQNINIINFLVALVCSATLFSCTADTLQKISSGELADQPIEEIINVKLIYTSDGKLRNELTAKKTVKYQIGDTAVYIFPNGIHIISYKDSIPESDLVADSATLNDNRGLFFTAFGNVVARNLITKKELRTDGPLNWNEKNKTIETKVYTEIYSETDTIYAKYGIFSDDRFKEVEMRGHSGVVFKEFG